jgi:hypothetical protein
VTILFCETLQVLNLVRLRAFRGGSLQIRDKRVMGALGLSPKAGSGVMREGE